MTNNPQLKSLQMVGDISLWDVIDFLKQGWRWLVGGGIVGLICSAGFVLVSSIQYEATAVIQPARVGVPTGATVAMKGAEVEPLLQTLERLKVASFFTPELVRVCEMTSAQALASSVKASSVKGNSLIQISYRSQSVAQAEACMQAIVAQLRNTQAMIAAPIVQLQEKQLEASRQLLAEAKELQIQIKRRMASSLEKTALLILDDLLRQEEISRLQKQVLEQSIQLSAPVTQSMQLLEPITVVAQKKLPMLAVGPFAGLLIGGLIFFVRCRWGLAHKQL